LLPLGDDSCTKGIKSFLCSTDLANQLPFAITPVEPAVLPLQDFYWLDALAQWFVPRSIT